MQNNLRYILIAGIFILPFIPLYVATSLYFPFVAGKAFAFRILIEILFALWIVLIIREPTYRPKFSWILVALAGFVVVLGLSNIFGENLYQSFWGTYERMEGYIMILHLFAYFLIASTVLNTEKLWIWFWKFSLGVSVIVAFFALQQISGLLIIGTDEGRIDATFGNATYFAGYLLFHIFLAAWMAVRARSDRLWIYVYAGLAIVHSVLLYLTATRGALLGLLAGLTVTAGLIAFAHRDNQKIRRITAGIILLAVFSVAGLFVVKDTNIAEKNLMLQRFSTISLDSIKQEGRYYSWGIAVDGFKEHPILGWGQENYSYVFEKYYRPELATVELKFFDKAHNVFLEWLVAGGIVGLLFYLGVFVAALALLWVKVREISSIEKSILIGMLIAYAIYGFFLFDTTVSYVLFFSTLAFIHFLWVEQSSPILKASLKHKPSKVQIVLQSIPDPILYGVVGITALGSIYFGNIQPIKTIFYYRGAEVSYAEDSAKAATLLKKAEDNATLEMEDLRLKFSDNLIEGIQNGSVAVVGRDGLIEEVIKALNKQITDTPDRALIYHQLGQVYIVVSRFDEAIPVLEQALVLSPQQIEIALDLGAAHLLNGDYDSAREILERAHALNKQHEKTRVVLAATAIYQGDITRSDELLEGVSDTLVIEDKLLLQSYLDTKNIDHLIPIFEARRQKDPNNLSLMVATSAAYFEIGDIPRAINIIMDAIKREPRFKEQGEEMIKDLVAGRRPE